MISSKFQHITSVFNKKSKRQLTKSILVFKTNTNKLEDQKYYVTIVDGGFSLTDRRELTINSFFSDTPFDVNTTKIPKNLTTTKFVVQCGELDEFIIHSTLRIGTCEKAEFRMVCSNLEGICNFEKADRYSVKIKIGHAFPAKAVLESICSLISAYNLENFFD